MQVHTTFENFEVIHLIIKLIIIKVKRSFVSSKDGVRDVPFGRSLMRSFKLELNSNVVGFRQVLLIIITYSSSVCEIG